MTDDPTPTRRAHWAWCRTDDHANYIDGDCGCWCHGQVEGQESLIPDAAMDGRQRGDLTLRIKMQPGADPSDEERVAFDVATRVIELIRLAARNHGSDLADDAVTFVVERDNEEQLR